MSTDSDCLFCKIIAGHIPSKKVYEDEEIFAFHDINPWAPVHFLMVPKVHIASMAQLGAGHTDVLGRMMLLAPKLALEQGCAPYPQGGFRLMVNTGADGGQEKVLFYMRNNFTFNSLESKSKILDINLASFMALLLPG